MKNRLMKYRLELLGAIIGAVAGFLYWKFIGCASGTCAITSSATNSTIYGAMMGSLVFSLFSKKNSTKS